MYRFITSCIDADGDDIVEMNRAAKRIEYRTMLNHVGGPFIDLQEALGYDTRGKRDTGLRMKNDWAVSYFRSVYRGRPCFFFRWSGIEHIFQDDGAPRQNPARSDFKFAGTAEILEQIADTDPDDADPDYLPDYEAIAARARQYPSNFHQERHVTWIGTKGYLVRIPVENICFMEGNQWYPAHAAALLRQIRSGENHYFEAPAGRIYRVSAKDVKQSEKYEADGELDYQLGMTSPWTNADVGEYWAQLLDGNHRAAAAILAGDRFVDVYISENYRDTVLKKHRI